MVVEMGGMERMVQLCRQEKERNYSDGVLIACLVRHEIILCPFATIGTIISAFRPPSGSWSHSVGMEQRKGFMLMT